MNRKILSYIQKYEMLPDNGNIVVGVSGGPDSVCLLYMLVKLRKELASERRLNLYAVHINHGLRKEAEGDEAFVKELCEAWDVPLEVRHVDVGRLAERLGQSCEEAGRRARYEAFEECLKKLDEGTEGFGCIAVAHHRDDRAETFLFNLFRGTGLDGMAGIRPVRLSESGARVIGRFWIVRERK
ncbi:MAG: tRNA lysidine(34) synthetase TilS [Eisenbergiella sp.]